MYISRLPLNGSRPSVVKILASPSKVHGAVEASFPPGDVGGCPQGAVENRGRILWRIDKVPNAGRSAWLYVVSPQRPDFTHLCEQAGWPEEGTWETKDYEPLLERIEIGQRWQFRLRANPVRKVLVDKGVKSERQVVGTIQGHVTLDQQVRWLLSREKSCGFHVVGNRPEALQLKVSQRERLSFRHAESRTTLTTALFDGVLEVSDEKALRHALCFGIGRAKAFGCGLLTLAPLI